MVNPLLLPESESEHYCFQSESESEGLGVNPLLLPEKVNIIVFKFEHCVCTQILYK